MPNINARLDRIAARERRRILLGTFLAIAVFAAVGFVFFGGLTATARLSYQTVTVIHVTISEAKHYPITALEVDMDGTRLAVFGPRQLAMLSPGDPVCLRKEMTIFGTQRFIATTDALCPDLIR